MPTLIKNFSEISIRDLALVGGKNASLGEMFCQLVPKGILVPDGFAVTSVCLRGISGRKQLARTAGRSARAVGQGRFFQPRIHRKAQARTLILNAANCPKPSPAAIGQAYRDLCAREGADISLAVRSSATAEDLPTASFAGRLESYLNIRGEEGVAQAPYTAAYSSLFTDRADQVPRRPGLWQRSNVALSVGVQTMVRSDLAASAWHSPSTPTRVSIKVVVIDSIYGLGENIVQGRSTPDEFVLFKPHLNTPLQPDYSEKIGDKEWTMTYADTRPAPPETSREQIDARRQTRGVFPYRCRRGHPGSLVRPNRAALRQTHGH
jgi:pyruvate,water dikinase